MRFNFIVFFVILVSLMSTTSAIFVPPSIINNSSTQPDDTIILNWTSGFYEINCGMGKLEVIIQNVSAGYWNDMICHTEYELPAYCGGGCIFNNTTMETYQNRGGAGFPDSRIKPIYLRISDSESIIFVNLVNGLNFDNQIQNKTEIYLNDFINLSINITDGFGLNQSFLQTNTSGTWENYSVTPLQNISYSWINSNFTWINSTISLNKTIGWKICAISSHGKQKCSSEKSFKLISDLMKPEIDQSRTCQNTSKLKFRVTDLGFGVKNVTSRIVLDGDDLGQVSLNSIGNDEWESESNVLDDNYTITVNATDKNNNINSTSFNITVETSPPEVSINLSDGETYDSTKNLEINVSGASQTWFNDVLEGMSGKFYKTLSLSEGLNVIKIKAIGKCGIESTKYLNLTKKTASVQHSSSGGGGSSSYIIPQETPSLQQSILLVESEQPPPEQSQVSVEKSVVEAKIISQIQAGQSSVVSFSSSPLRSVEIKVSNTVSNIEISVKEINETPKEIQDDRKIYKVMEVSVNKSENISEVNLTFDVEKMWLTNNSIEKKSVKMLKNHSGIWETLDTEFISETKEKVNYKAHSNGFSMFMIVGEIATTVIPTQTVSEIQEGFWKFDKVLGAIIVIISLVLLACIFKLQNINKQRKGGEKQ